MCLTYWDPLRLGGGGEGGGGWKQHGSHTSRQFCLPGPPPISPLICMKHFWDAMGPPSYYLGVGGHLIRLDMLFIWFEAPPQKGAYFGMQGKQLREGSRRNIIIHQNNNSESNKDRKKHGRMNSLFCYPNIQTCISNCTKMQISKEKMVDVSYYFLVNERLLFFLRLNFSCYTQQRTNIW